LTEIYNLVSNLEVGHDDFTVQELITDYTTPNLNLEEDTLVVLNPEGQIVASQDVFATDPIPVHPTVWGRVHPDYTGLGLGTYLIRWGIERARHVLDKVPEEYRVAVHSFSLDQAEESIKLIEAHGYTPRRHFFRMKIEMNSAPPAPEWPEGIRLETCTIPDGIPNYFRALDDAFKDHFGYIEEPFDHALAEFKHRRLKDDGFDPSLWFQAMDGDEIVGICLGRKTGWESEKVGHVNVLGVRRPWRKRGLGLALLNHIFNVYWERGQHIVKLGVDADSLTGAVGLYERAGMKVIHQFNVYQLELRPGIELGKTSAED
ncbi:MAG: GNAT family N-acetyltransferase, partial [Chloroflexota bacterium]